MTEKKVSSTYNEEVIIDYDKKKLYDYDNAKKEITYSAPIIENGIETQFWAEFKETGIVSDIEERLKKWNNGVTLIYAKMVNFDSTKNDPDRKIWKKLVEYIKSHENEIFYKNGNFKRGLTIDPARIAKDLERRINPDIL